MYKLEVSGLFRRKIRLVASEKLTASDFKRISEKLGVEPLRARKIGLIAARKSGKVQTVETRWNGKETQSEAAPEDWIVTNLGPDGKPLVDGQGSLNVYVIRAARLLELYVRTERSSKHGDIYSAISEVEALYLSGGFKLLAPWGETQTAVAGYLLCNGGEVYGNHEETFRATYKIIE